MQFPLQDPRQAAQLIQTWSCDLQDLHLSSCQSRVRSPVTVAMKLTKFSSLTLYTSIASDPSLIKDMVRDTAVGFIFVSFAEMQMCMQALLAAMSEASGIAWRVCSRQQSFECSKNAQLLHQQQLGLLCRGQNKGYFASSAVFVSKSVFVSSTAHSSVA